MSFVEVLSPLDFMLC